MHHMYFLMFRVPSVGHILWDAMVRTHFGTRPFGYCIHSKLQTATHGSGALSSLGRRARACDRAFIVVLSMATMSLTPEQLTELIARVVVGVQQSQAASQQPPTMSRSQKKFLDEKEFRRMQTFSGKDTEWKEWHFSMKMCTRAADVDVERCLDYAEGKGRDFRLEDLKVFACEMGDLSSGFEAAGAELFRVLCMLTSGEANTRSDLHPARMVSRHGTNCSKTTIRGLLRAH